MPYKLHATLEKHLIHVGSIYLHAYIVISVARFHLSLKEIQGETQENYENVKLKKIADQWNDNTSSV